MRPPVVCLRIFPFWGTVPFYNLSFPAICTFYLQLLCFPQFVRLLKKLQLFARLLCATVYICSFCRTVLRPKGAAQNIFGKM